MYFCVNVILSLKNKSKNIQFNLGGFLIALLMLLAFSTKEMHLFMHHQHEEVKICDAREGEHHFHGQDYIHANCQLCDFTFSLFELSLAQKLNFPEPKTVILSQTFSYTSFLSFKYPVFTLLRGPPICA